MKAGRDPAVYETVDPEGRVARQHGAEEGVGELDEEVGNGTADGNGNGLGEEEKEELRRVYEGRLQAVAELGEGPRVGAGVRV